MTAYIIKRLLQALIVLFLVSVIVFLAVRLLPGDPAMVLLSRTEVVEVNEEALTKLRIQLGLDKPIHVQYYTWITGAFKGDLGKSLQWQTPVVEEILKRLPVSLHLGALAFIAGVIFGLPLGIIAAVRRGKWQDTLVTTLANIGITVPVFWLALILVYIFAIKLSLLPVFGYVSPFKDFWMNTQQIIMPVVCLSLFPIAGATRQTRSSVLEVMQQDYVRTAICKGLSETVIIWKHVLKNAIIPVITLQGLAIAPLIGGQVLIETVFGISGIGRLIVNAVLSLDYPVVQGGVLLVAVLVLAANFLVDISYGWFDPRIRY